MAEYAYCPTCDAAVEFTTVKRIRMTDYEGKRYRYPVKQALCVQCGKEATYPPYQEETGLAFNECLRKGNGLVSLKDVCEVPKRYDIGKRPLSRILGFGEHTYEQLMEGQAPSPEHSDLIRLVFEDPCFYRSLLESRKDAVSDATYRRSLDAVEAYMQRSLPDDYRIYELGRAFVCLAHGDITAMAIQKLTYYYQGFGEFVLGRRPFSQMPRAWAAGPVYGRLWHEYKEDPRDYFSYREDEEYSSPFTPAEDELLLAITRSFGCYSGTTLSEMTHAEDPWTRARERAGAPAEARCSERITADDMHAFFGQVVREYGIIQARDVERYARAKFREVTSVLIE